MKRIIAILTFTLLLLLASCSSTNQQDLDIEKAQKIMDYNKKKFDNLALSGKVVNGIRQIDLKSYQYSFDPDTIVVKKGEKIRLTIDVVDVPHGFEIEGMHIPGWDINEPLKKGEKKTAEFTADDAGSWDMVCTTYCGPGHSGMKGKFIVKE